METSGQAPRTKEISNVTCQQRESRAPGKEMSGAWSPTGTAPLPLYCCRVPSAQGLCLFLICTQTSGDGPWTICPSACQMIQPQRKMPSERNKRKKEKETWAMCCHSPWKPNTWSREARERGPPRKKCSR